MRCWWSVIIHGIVFDMDGLALDSEPVYRDSWKMACAELGFALDDHAYERYIGRPTPECEPELAEHFGPSFPLPAFQSLWPKIWTRLARERGIAPKPGLADLVSLLEKRRIPFALATSSDREYTDVTLRAARLTELFPTVITRDEVARGKPAPDVYLEAAQRLGLPPAECLALEDSDAGVLAAASAGMPIICIPDLKAPSDAASHAAYRVVANLGEARQLIEPLIPPENDFDATEEYLSTRH